MPAPVIYQVSSLQPLVRGRSYALQLALAPGSDAATSWAIVSGGLPSGLSLNTVTGLIAGTPNAAAEGSTYTVGVAPVNGSGTGTPQMLVFGVEYARADEDGGITAVINLDTGVVGFPGTTQRTEENRALIHLRRGDAFGMAVQFVREGMVVDLPITGIRITGKKEETDPPISFQAPGDYLFLKEGSGETARYIIWLSLNDEKLAADLDDEAKSPKGAAVIYTSEIRFQWTRSMGEQAARTAERSTLEFAISIHRDSLP